MRYVVCADILKRGMNVEAWLQEMLRTMLPPFHTGDNESNQTKHKTDSVMEILITERQHNARMLLMAHFCPNNKCCFLTPQIKHATQIDLRRNQHVQNYHPTYN